MSQVHFLDLFLGYEPPEAIRAEVETLAVEHAGIDREARTISLRLSSGVYITEAYVDSYPWANPFVGLSDYYGKEITGSSGNPIRVDLAQFVSIQPSGKPQDPL